jgi:hypothetical protein
MNDFLDLQTQKGIAEHRLRKYLRKVKTVHLSAALQRCGTGLRSEDFFGIVSTLYGAKFLDMKMGQKGALTLTLVEQPQQQPTEVGHGIVNAG